MPFLASLLRPFLLRRAETIASVIAAELQSGDSVLDIGGGDMLVGQSVTRKLDVSWRGVDTIPYDSTPLPTTLYDGRTLPFPDGSFSVASLIFVLHHCDDPERVLDEAVRISRSSIIVVEDLPEGRFGLLRAKLHDLAMNWLLEPNMAMPYAFRSLAGWQALFAARGLKLARVQILKTQPLAFVRQTLFVLKKTADPPVPLSEDEPHTNELSA